MKEAFNPRGIDPELEARIVAMVLGEASDVEQEQLRRLIDVNLELSEFKNEIQAANSLLRDIGSCEWPVAEGEWGLSSEKRDLVLATIDGEPIEPTTASDLKPLIFPFLAKDKVWWNFGRIAAAVCGAAVFGLLAMATFLYGRATRMARNQSAVQWSDGEAFSDRFTTSPPDMSVSATGPVVRYDGEPASFGSERDIERGVADSGVTSAPIVVTGPKSALSEIQKTLGASESLLGEEYLQADVENVPSSVGSKAGTNVYTFRDDFSPDRTPSDSDFTYDSNSLNESRESALAGSGERMERDTVMTPFEKREGESIELGSRDSAVTDSKAETAAPSEPVARLFRRGESVPPQVPDAQIPTVRGRSRFSGRELESDREAIDLGNHDDNANVPANLDGRVDGVPGVATEKGAIQREYASLGKEVEAESRKPFDQKATEGFADEVTTLADEVLSQERFGGDKVRRYQEPVPNPTEGKKSNIIVTAENGIEASAANESGQPASGEEAYRNFDKAYSSLQAPEASATPPPQSDRVTKGLLTDFGAAPKPDAVTGWEMGDLFSAAEFDASKSEIGKSENDKSLSDFEQKESLDVDQLRFQLPSEEPPMAEAPSASAGVRVIQGQETNRGDAAGEKPVSGLELLDAGFVPLDRNKEWNKYNALQGGLRSKLAATAGLNEQRAADEAFSTFSLHVSDVSFKLAQAALARGEWPEVGKIRVEEFVNAFDYGDPLPRGDEKVSCQLEQSIHPFIQQRNLLRVSMRTAAEGRASSTPLRITILLDNSGSMERIDRQQIVKRAFALLAQQLTPIDQVTLISFARQPRLLADKVNGAQSSQLVELIEELPSEGGTNLEAALQLAFEKAIEQKTDGSQNRIVLLTDGAVNLGDANPVSLSGMITAMRDAGVAFDAAGIGSEGLNDEVLEALTRKGDGRYYLLDSVDDADDGFAQQIAGALRPSAKNVKVQVEFNPKRVGWYKLLGFEKHRLNQEDFRNDNVDAAEMAAAEAGVAVYQFEPLPDGEGDVGSVSVRFRDLSTGEMVENRWPILYEAAPRRAETASPSMGIATVAAMFAAKLQGEPLGGAVELNTLSELLAGLPEQNRNSPRVQQLQGMIQQAEQLVGNK